MAGQREEVVTDGYGTGLTLQGRSPLYYFQSPSSQLQGSTGWDPAGSLPTCDTGPLHLWLQEAEVGGSASPCSWVPHNVGPDSLSLCTTANILPSSCRKCHHCDLQPHEPAHQHLETVDNATVFSCQDRGGHGLDIHSNSSNHHTCGLQQDSHQLGFPEHNPDNANLSDRPSPQQFGHVHFFLRDTYVSKLPPAPVSAEHGGPVPCSCHPPSCEA